jgi:hypothetical protein
VSDKRKRAIRALMAETGMKYMAAMREVDRRHQAELNAHLAEQLDNVQPEESSR